MNRSLLVLCAAILLILAAGITAFITTHRSRGTGSALAPPSAAPARPEFERATDPTGVTRVYHTRLEDGDPGDEWSIAPVAKTTKGDRPYLGMFNPGEPVTLTIPALPPHKLVRITFDLFLFRSWDGSSPAYGYTRWDLDADDRSLIHTTFNNCGFFRGGNDKEAFPDTWPSRWHTAWTLAAEHETLGYSQSWGNYTADASCVYHFVLTFPHADPQVVFHFESTMQRDRHKFYGLTNVEVHTLPELAAYSEDQLAAFWQDLGSSDPAKFWNAQWALAQAGDAATTFIASHLADNIDMSPGAAAKLFTFLDADDPTAQPVFDRLAMQGRTLGDLYARPPVDNSPRLAQLVDLAQRFPATATELRNARAKHLLGIIHTPAALALAEKIEDQPIGPQN